MKEKGVSNFIAFTGKSQTTKADITSFDQMLAMFWDNILDYPTQMPEETGIWTIKVRM